MKILVIGNKDVKIPDSDKHEVVYLDPYYGHELNEAMDLYETIDSSYCDMLRQDIIDINPDLIVGVGKSDEYRWDVTVATRVFGIFNAWLGQYDKDFGKTEININGNKVPLYAFDNQEGIEAYLDI